MAELLETTRLLTQNGPMKRRRSPGGTAYRYLRIQDSRNYSEGAGLILFLAYANPELFDPRTVWPKGKILFRKTVRAQLLKLQEGVANAVKEAKGSKPGPKKKSKKDPKKPKKQVTKNASNKTPQPSSSSSKLPVGSPSSSHASSSSHVRRRTQEARFKILTAIREKMWKGHVFRENYQFCAAVNRLLFSSMLTMIYNTRPFIYVGVFPPPCNAAKLEAKALDSYTYMVRYLWSIGWYRKLVGEFQGEWFHQNRNTWWLQGYSSLPSFNPL